MKLNYSNFWNGSIFLLNSIKHFAFSRKSSTFALSKRKDNNIVQHLKITIMEKKKINNNGYEYVDLELPSGTLWATMNVGAKKPLDGGLYFQWGDTKGYTKEQVGKDKQFSWTNYKFSINGSDENFSKYIKEGAKLELEDDAAHANMGGDWHMPSPTQIQELINNTKSAWAKQNGINGRLFTSKRNPSKSIFIPAAGGAMDGLVLNSDRYGLTWSSMLTIFLVRFAKNICFNSEDIYLSYNFSSRCNGFPVRGVIG